MNHSLIKYVADMTRFHISSFKKEVSFFYYIQLFLFSKHQDVFASESELMDWAYVSPWASE